MATISLQPVPANELSIAAQLCAVAMRDNPLHIKVFGKSASKREQRLTRLFNGLLIYIHRKRELIGAYNNGHLVGVMGCLPPAHCQPSLAQLLRLVPTLLSSNSPLGLFKTLYWLRSWASLDPPQPHWHLGPLAVDSDWRGQGIGRLLITDTMNTAFKQDPNAGLYLETDKLVNVEFYQRLGFSTLATPTLLSTPTWLMLNLPHRSPTL